MDTVINYVSIIIEKRLDAEYYKAKFLNLNKKLDRKKFVKLKYFCEFISSGPSGAGLASSNYTAKGIRVLRPSNLDGWNCNGGEFVFVERKYCQRKKLKFYKKGDILITRIGNLKFGIIESDKDENFVISPNLFAIRTNKKVLNPYFLLAFLNSKSGSGQIYAGAKAGVMGSINKKHIEQLLLPQASIERQRKIAGLVRAAMKDKRDAEKIERKVERILNSAINFEINKHKNFSYVLNVAKLQKARRADAEYFLMRNETPNNQAETVMLGNICDILPGMEAGRNNYQNGGRLFLRPSNIDSRGLLDKSQKYITDDLFEKLRIKFQPQAGNILLVKDGKPGTALVVTKEIEGIISSGIVRLRIFNSKFFPEYICAAINSTFCREQIKNNIDGSLVPHWKTGQIKLLRIPVVPDSVQVEIRELVREVYLLMQKAEHDLLLAKKLLDRILIKEGR